MSGRYRNIVLQEKIKAPGIINLPEVIQESPSKLNIKIYAEESYDAEDQPIIRNYGKFSYNSIASSAQSQRFPHIFQTTDWPSLSDTGTDSPDCIELEGSDSSASSMFSWADAESTRLVTDEWDKIQRTLYDEEGPKVTQPSLIEECNQWKAIFPHLRVVGHGYYLGNSENDESCDTEEEVLALNYDSDVNSSDKQKPVVGNNLKSAHQKLLPLRMQEIVINEKSNKQITSNKPIKKSAISLIEKIDSFLHITPLNKNLSGNMNTSRYQTHSIIKSDISSSRWRHRKAASPDFVSLPYNISQNVKSTRDSSAVSLFSNPSKKKYNRDVSNSTWHDDEVNDKHYVTNRIISDKQSNMLEPIDSLLISKSTIQRSVMSSHNEDIFKSSAKNGRNISLPPIQSDENKGRRKQNTEDKVHGSGKYYRTHKKTLSPINAFSNNGSKHMNGNCYNVNSLESKVDVQQKSKKNRKISRNHK